MTGSPDRTTARPPGLWVRLENLLGTYSPAAVGLYLFTFYLLGVSLYNLGVGVWARLEGAPLLGAGREDDPLYELGTSLGFWGSLYFCLNFLLATRWRWVEALFGGLDKVYRAHAFLGRATLTLVLLHAGILVLQALPDGDRVAEYLVPGLSLSYTLGVAGTLFLTLLVALTVWVRLRYQTWLGSHRWMGLAFVLGNLHAIVAQADWYMVLMTLVGAYAWLYNLFLYRRLAPQRKGRLVGNLLRHNVNELTVELPQPLEAQAGQFVFFSVAQSASGLGGELHPFSISGLEGRRLRITAKQLGDFTRRLHELEPGDRITVYGPYGRFGEPFLKSHRPALWVAGGIGVTPFLSLLRHEAAQPRPERPVRFVWSVSRPEDAVYLEEIEQLSANLPHLEFRLHVSGAEGYLEAGRLETWFGREHLEAALVFVCGPAPLARKLLAGLRGRGKNRREVISEEFGLR